MTRMVRLSLIALTLLSLPDQAVGDEAGTGIAELRAELLAILERLDTLEATNQQLREENARLKTAEATPAKPSTGGDSWTDRIRLKGDFRLRYEAIDEQGKDRRNRDRIRARLAVIAAATENVEVGLGLATGGDDPVSTNQTLGGGGSSKGINLDLAYAKWSGWDHGSITAGKFKNPLYTPGGHAMLWDGDWNPEGLAFSWSRQGYFVNLLGGTLESDSSRGSEFSWSMQTGFNFALGEGAELTAGLAYHHFDTAGKSTFFGDADDFFGNSFDPASLTYLYDYHEIEFFAALGFEVAGKDAEVFLDYVQNRAADRNDTGYAAGFSLGGTRNAGDWELSYAYQDLEADAALGLLSDSDFGGGGTGVRGHVFGLGYGITRNVNANLTYLMNERLIDTAGERDYDRLQLDLAFKY